MTRKKFIKYCMGKGIQRDSAQALAQRFNEGEYTYAEAKNSSTMRTLCNIVERCGGGNFAVASIPVIGPRIRPLAAGKKDGYRADVVIFDEMHGAGGGSHD